MKVSIEYARPVFLAIAISLGLSGCGLQWFIPPKENPVISDDVGRSPGVMRDFKVLSNTPERRMIIFNVSEGHSRFGKFCSEAPADAGESLSSSVTAALKATKGNSNATAEAAKTLATALQSLTPRSQGVVMFRDAAYFYCQLYMNGLLDGDELVVKMDKSFGLAKELVETELDKNDGKIGYGPPVGKDAPPHADSSDTQKNEATKKAES